MEPDKERELRLRYEKDLPALESLTAEAEAFVNGVCARLTRGSFHLRLTESRLKSMPAIIRKLDERGAGVSEFYDSVTDLVGLRVVVYNTSDVARFRQELEHSGSPIQHIEVEEVERPSGYRALHINGWIGDSPRVGCEIQVRTALQDAWAVISRADMYRSEPETDPPWSTLARVQANVVQAVDEVLQTIRDFSERSRREDEPTQPVIEEPPPEVTRSAPLDSERIEDIVAGLAPDERLVLQTPVSKERIEELRTGVIRLRESEGLRQLFKATGAYKRELAYEARDRFGLRSFVWKGPFVAGSNWVSFFPEDFHRSLENFLERLFAQRLLKDAGDLALASIAADVPSFIGRAVQDINGARGEPNLVVLLGRPGLEMYRLFDWRPAGTGLPNPLSHLTHERLVGNLPVYRADVASDPAIFVMDLGRAYRYVQSNANHESDDDLYFNVEELTEGRAAEIVNARPDILPPAEGVPLSREESVVRLQLQVLLDITEAGRIEGGDPRYVRGARLPAGGEP